MKRFSLAGWLTSEYQHAQELGDAITLMRILILEIEVGSLELNKRTCDQCLLE